MLMHRLFYKFLLLPLLPAGKKEDGQAVAAPEFTHEQLDSTRVEDLVSESMSKSDQVRIKL